MRTDCHTAINLLGSTAPLLVHSANVRVVSKKGLNDGGGYQYPKAAAEKVRAQYPQVSAVVDLPPGSVPGIHVAMGRFPVLKCLAI